ncbi:MAG: glycoside hydrolase family 2 [Phycisphaerae bacterium]|nr:glycoside hydrolase family 2 [Phycisphaerae bacterium]
MTLASVLNKFYGIILVGIISSGIFVSATSAAWQPADGPLMTRWAKEVSPQNALPEYPRPQMTRDNWLNLNGLWQYAICPKENAAPKSFDGDILVPYPAESALSGVMKPVGKDNRLWYKRQFTLPNKWKNQRVLLHFGAVDWETAVTINGQRVGFHRGGYDPFTFDITNELTPTGPQEIIVSVWDPTSDGHQPRGKQRNNPGGIFYTPVTGIWQTAWLEPVPQTYIKSLKITPDIDNSTVKVTVNVTGGFLNGSIEATISSGPGNPTTGTSTTGSDTFTAKILSPKLWSPDSPNLYDLKVSLKQNGKIIDTVSSYFGMRKIAIGKDKNGHQRLWLNNKVLFQHGPLDQGWWPDGLYTAATDDALRYDIEVTKKLGFNMARKHVKVEPARWYYWCDKLGLIVWQDMPNPRLKGDDLPAEAREQFEAELKALVDTHYNVPSIVMWVPFNEGWGQYDTERIAQWVKQYDPTRLVNNASGWTDKGVGDLHDIHSYPGPAKPANEDNRAGVLGEYGGLGLPVKGHTWQDSKNWGYRSFTTRSDLTDAYLGLSANLRPLIGDGLAAAVYTQTSDVEVEVNGLMTYDRAMIKKDLTQVLAANQKLYLPPPVIKTIIPTAQKNAAQWHYTTEKPADNWQQPDFDFSNWKTGPAGFGTASTPNTTVRTEWKTSDIWTRRTFNLNDVSPENLVLTIFHDEDATVYINGHLAAKLTGFTTSYINVPISSDALKSLKRGKNTIAIHCKQTNGGQFIDAGISQVIEQN